MVAVNGYLRCGQTGTATERCEGCFKKAVPTAYDRFLRSYVPETGNYVTCNGVRFIKTRWTDKVLPEFVLRNTQTTDDPEYESELIAALQLMVEEGDDVVVVGGGKGISTVVASQCSGNSGHVDVFEGSKRHFEQVQRTVRLNGCTDSVDVHHAIVADDISLRGNPGAVETVSPTALPDCDVLELDCEGAELDVIREMAVDPRVIIAETHPQFDSPTAAVKSALTERGYEIVAESETDEGPNIDILTAVRT